MIKYWPTVLEIYFTDQLGPFVYSHSFSGEQFYLALILLQVIWVEAIFFDNFLVDFFAEKSKIYETLSMDFKIESPNYGDQR